MLPGKVSLRRRAQAGNPEQQWVCIRIPNLRNKSVLRDLRWHPNKNPTATCAPKLKDET